MVNKKQALSLIFCIMLVCLQLFVTTGHGDETISVEGSQVYLVRPGDTLSKIAGKFKGDVRLWEELLKANPQITDADLIFPGDAVIVGEAPAEIGLGVREKEPAPKEEALKPAIIASEELLEALREEPEHVIALKPVSFKEAPSIASSVYESCGYISPDLPEASILGSPESKGAMTKFDTVFINRGDRDGLTVGQQFQILRPVREIFHPKTGISMGWLIKVIGTLRTECLQEKTATARITNSYDYAMAGDRIEPYTPLAVPSDHYLSPKLTGPCIPSSEGLEGLILADKEGKGRIAEGDIVYIDKGLASGITPGVKFAVYRQGIPGEQECNYLLGELQVLLSRNYTSTALVTNSIYPFGTEDRLVAW